MKYLKIMVITVCIVGMFAILGNYETHYTMKAKVYRTTETSTVFKDISGNYWEILDTTYIDNDGIEKPFEPKQEFALYFYDNTTTTRGDDIIDKVTKIKDKSH